MKHNKNEKKTKLTRRSVSLLLALVLMTSAFAPGAAYATEGFGPARKQVASKEIVEVPEETAAPETVAPETTVPEVTFPERVPTETTAPAETLPEEVLEVDPAYAQAIADLDALAEEAKTLADGLDAEAEGYIEKLTENCNDFYDRLLERLNGIADMWDANEITKEEYDFAEGKILEIVQGLKERYGYQNRGIATLETVDTLIEGTSAATGLDGKSYHLILKRGHLALQDVVNEVSSTSTDATTGETVTSEYTRIGLSRINQQNIDKWTFISADVDGGYYIKSESDKYLTFNKSAGNATLSDTPVVTYVRYADVSETTPTTIPDLNKEGKPYTVVTNTWRVYSFIQKCENGTAYVLNQYGGADFTKFPNAAAFNDTKSVVEDPGNLFLLKEPVSTVPSAAENINMNLFNYGHNINNDNTTMLNFFHGYNYGSDGVDGVHRGSSNVQVMESTLVNGYPKQTLRTVEGKQVGGLSYEYLFNPNKATISRNTFYANIYPSTDTKGNGPITFTYNDNNAIANFELTADTSSTSNTVYEYQSAYFPISNSNGSGTGLFRKDVPGYEGYYVYDSAVNAAWYNPETGKFDLYDYVIRPPYTDFEGTSAQGVGNFLPFNQGHTAGHEDYGTFEAPSSTKVGNIDAYRLDGTDQASDVDLWFGMNLEFDFNMPTGGMMNDDEMVFMFHGDDDVYVYIDDVLVLDIGGTHAATSASINFATGEVINPDCGYMDGTSDLRTIFENAGVSTSKFKPGTNTFDDWTSHNLKFYYMERGGNISYCRLQFNMEPLPKGGATVTKALDANTQVTDVISKLQYTFKLVKVNSDGTETAVGNAPYKTGTSGGVTDKNGYFTIGASETAAFNELITTNEGLTYRVYEVAGDKFDISNVTYSGSEHSAGVQNKDSEEFVPKYVEFVADPKDAQNNVVHASVFVNTIKTTDFTVEKQVTGNLGDWAKDFNFTAELYTKEGEGRTKISFDDITTTDTSFYTVEDGVAKFTLSDNEKVTFTGIPLGAYVVITEDPDGYIPAAEWGKQVSDVDEEGNSVWVFDGGTSKGTTSASFVTTLDTSENVENNAAVFTNDLTATIETGVVLDSLPYILILGGVAAVAVFLFIRRRRAYED